MDSPIITKMIRSPHSGCETSLQPGTSRQVTLTNDPSLTLSPAISTDTCNAISSQESAGGPTRSGLQGGQTTDLFGRAHVPVSHFQRLGMVEDSKTLVTYGQSSTGSFVSARLQRSLENKLRKQNFGSKLFALTWKGWATPSGRQFCRLQVSALRTSENDSGLWPTPTASMSTGAGRQGRQGGMNLQTAVKVFPTPTANRWDGLQNHGVNVVTGQLNPTWVAWLMGYPLAWVDYAASATPSSRKSQRNSSSQPARPSHD